LPRRNFGDHGAVQVRSSGSVDNEFCSSRRAETPSTTE
jgi:hypothetical protein